MNNLYCPQTRRLLGMQDTYPQDFVVNDGLLLRILRAPAHCPLEMLVFSLHVAVKLALTSPTDGGRSVGIVRLRTMATEFFM